MLYLRIASSSTALFATASLYTIHTLYNTPLCSDALPVYLESTAAARASRCFEKEAKVFHS